MDNGHNIDHSLPGAPPSKEAKSGLVLDKRVIITSFKSKLKWVFSITIIMMLVVAVFVSLKVNPVWKANCRVIRMQKNISTPTDMPYLYNAFDINTILETARSRPVFNRIIEKLELEGMEAGDIGRTVNVQRGHRSNVLSFSVVHADAEMAVLLANTLGETFIELSIELQNASADSVNSYYRQKREERLALIAQFEEKILLFQKDNDLISIDSERDQMFEKLKLLEIRKVETAMKIDEMRIKIDDLNNKINSLPEEVMLTWSFSNTDESKLLLLKKDLELKLTRYTDQNPKILKIRSEIDVLEKKIADPKRVQDPPDLSSWGPNGVIQTYQVDITRYEGEYNSSKARFIEYQNEIDKVKAILTGFNMINDDYLEIARQLELSRDILRIIEGRIAESQMAIETNTNDFQLFEPAIMPKYPINVSKKTIILGVGIMIFMMLSAFFVAKELFDFTVKSRLEYEKYFDIPLIGEIPAEEGANPNKFYANLQYVLDNVFDLVADVPKPPIMTLGSAIAGTGKSFVMNEFSKMLASTKRIIIIECVQNLTVEIEDYEINTYLDDNHSFDTKEVSHNIEKCYFWIGEHIFKKMYSANDFHRLYGLFMDYDYVIWEMFPSRYNIQLYHAIAKSADVNIIVSKFRHSPRVDVYNLIGYLYEKRVSKVYGILNCIPKDYYVDLL